MAPDGMGNALEASGEKLEAQPSALAAFLRIAILCSICLTGGSALAGPDTIVLAEVKMEDLPFRKAFPHIRSLLERQNLKAAIDPVHNIPGNFDNPRDFTFVRKNVPLGELLTAFCRYYGLEWSRSGETIIFSLPRPRQ